MQGSKTNRFFKRGAVIISLLLAVYLVYRIMVFLAPALNVRVITSENPPEGFSLKTGDMLARPNWNWLPGSAVVREGSYSGHVSIVIKGAEGKSITEALRKAIVIEGVIFDQSTRKFIFGSKDIIRRTSAIISFGERFRGRRYILRMDLDERQQKFLIRFLSAQLDDDHYTIFSFKEKTSFPPGSAEAYRSADRDQWNCASLAWFAYHYVTGKDIDANKGILIYPNDIIRSHYFDLPGRRIRF